MLACSATQATAKVQALQVINSNGVPQADAVIVDTTLGRDVAISNSNGLVTFHTDRLPDGRLTDVRSTDTFAVTRTQDNGAGNPCLASTEGYPGAASVKLGEPGIAVVPTLPGVAYQPQISSEELGMVGLINQVRQQSGLAPVTISTVLTASADKYLSSLPAGPLDYQSLLTYCYNAGPGIRAVDQGFPTVRGVFESVVRGQATAHGSLRVLRDQLYNSALTNASATLIGIAQQGDTWVIDTSILLRNYFYYYRAGDTGNAGDAALATPEQVQVSPASEAIKRQPGLEFKRVDKQGKHIKARLRVNKKAKGKVHVVAIKKGKKGKKSNKKQVRRLDVSRNRARLKVSGRLPQGKWILKATFRPRNGSNWTTDKIERQVKIKPKR